MNLRLAPNWGVILRRAWSVRFMVLAAILAGLEVFLPMVEGIVDVPPGLFAALTALSSAAALFTRFLAQAGITLVDKD